MISMADLLSSVVDHSVEVAQPIAEDFTEANMKVLVAITRPSKDTFDRNAGIMIEVPDVAVYTGKARLTGISGNTTYDLGDEPQYFGTGLLSVPLSATRPRVNDNVRVLEHRDPTLVDRRFRITGVDTGGFIPAAHRCAVVGIEPAQNVTP